MVSQGRAERIAQRIQEELSEMLIFSVTDPRIQGVFITKVRVDREMSYANVFVSAVEGAERETEIMEGLEHASGYFRSNLAKLLQLRHFPRLRFHWDPSPEHADRIDRLIDSLKNEKKQGDDQ